MFYQLPPAGERILLKRDRRESGREEALFSPYSARYYNSGTSALAAALKVAIAQSGKTAPEVLLPAYGCPDLVSAVLHAGARPRLVDLAPDRPWLDLNQLRSAIGANTVAVVAVDLFGIPERHSEIRSLLKMHGVLLIQDSAQSLPRPETGQWQGDYVILSFGRGKPVSLLGGGAVLYRDAALGTALPERHALPSLWSAEIRFRLKALAYNALVSPFLYWLPASLPFLRLGATRFKPMDAIIGADPVSEQFLPENVRAYWIRPAVAQSRLTEIFSLLDSKRILDLFRACCVSGQAPRLLRYPVLVQDPERRESLYQAAGRKGLGLSKMYPAPLPAVPGLEGLFPETGDAYPNATAFSRQILTFPVHRRVSEKDLLALRACLHRAISR